MLSVSGLVVNPITGRSLVLALTLYLLFTLPMVKSWGYRLASASRGVKVQELGEQVTDSGGNHVIGQACLALLNATVSLGLMTVTGVPCATLLALCVAVLAFVPLVG